MKAFKTVLIGLLVIVVVIIAVTFFLPSQVNVEESIEVNAPAGTVYEQVNVLPNWEKWSPWHDLDTAMAVTYSEPNSGKGSYYTWKSDDSNVGAGKITISDVKEGSEVHYDMEFEGQGGSKSSFLIDNLGDNKSKITWTFEGDFGFFGRWAAILGAKSMLKESYQKGLKNIKELVENIPPYKYEIVMENVPETHFLAVKDSVPMSDTLKAKELITAGFGELMAYMQENNLPFDESKMPVCVTDYWGGDKWVFNCGMPVDNVEGLTPAGRVTIDKIPACNAVKLKYIGPYEKTEPAYNEIKEYMKDKKLTQAGRPWEKYMNDPENTPPEELLMYIYFPVKS